MRIKTESIFAIAGVILIAGLWALLLRPSAKQTPAQSTPPPSFTDKKPPAKSPGPPRNLPVNKVLDSVVIKDVSYSGEPMSDAIELVTRHLDKYCARKNIVPITVEQATSKSTMSFSSSAMTANMLLKMIASEARMDLVIDSQGRDVRFSKRP